jgi:hypothetical protein
MEFSNTNMINSGVGAFSDLTVVDESHLQNSPIQCRHHISTECGHGGEEDWRDTLHPSNPSSDVKMIFSLTSLAIVRFPKAE